MKPLVLGEFVLRLHLDSIIRPGMRQMRLKTFIRCKKVEATKTRAFLHLAYNRAIAFEPHPCAVTERVGKLKSSERAEVRVCLAVELQGLAEETVGKLRFLSVNDFAVSGSGRRQNCERILEWDHGQQPFVV